MTAAGREAEKGWFLIGVTTVSACVCVCSSGLTVYVGSFGIFITLEAQL